MLRPQIGNSIVTFYDTLLNFGLWGRKRYVCVSVPKECVSNTKPKACTAGTYIQYIRISVFVQFRRVMFIVNYLLKDKFNIHVIYYLNI